MSALPSRPFVAVLGLLALSWPAAGEPKSDISRHLRQLQSPDMTVQLDGIEGLETSLDPRIPDACLGALRSESETVRRLALRALGSRWHQIPATRAEEFLAAIAPSLDSPGDGLANMARRARALISHRYRSPMVSVSRSRRWVIYERRGLPCLIDTQTSTEELLGWPVPEEDLFTGFKPRIGNEEVQPAVHWHPRQDKVALEIFLHRRASTLWVWAHGTGLRQFSVEDLLQAIGHRREEILEVAGFHARDPRWKGAALEFQLDFTLARGGRDDTNWSARLRWDSATNRLQELSRAELAIR